MPHYFYIYNISSYDFGAIQTLRAEIYIFTTGTHHIKLVAERSYHLRCGQVFLL